MNTIKINYLEHTEITSPYIENTVPIRKGLNKNDETIIAGWTITQKKKLIPDDGLHLHK